MSGVFVENNVWSRAAKQHEICQRRRKKYIECKRVNYFERNDITNKENMCLRGMAFYKTTHPFRLVENVSAGNAM